MSALHSATISGGGYFSKAKAVVSKHKQTIMILSIIILIFLVYKYYWLPKCSDSKQPDDVCKLLKKLSNMQDSAEQS